MNDAAIDAPIDAPDAAPCPAVDDRDGDGVCDAVDDCPDVADPGQPDLDGDGIGWMCDPVESVMLDTSNNNTLEQLAFHGDTFAARSRSSCAAYNICDHELLQVSAAGKMIVRSDSTNPRDAWQAAPAVAWMGGPFITAQDRVLWSRGYEMGDTGDFDLATRQFTSRATGVFSLFPPTDFSVLNDGALLAASLSTAELAGNFDDIHGDGTISIVETAQSFGFEQPAITVPGAIPRALVPVRENFTTALRLYTQGAPALTDILVGTTPLTNIDDLETVLVDGYPRGFCAQTGTQVVVVDWDRSNTIATHILPLASCLHLEGTDRGDARFYLAYDQHGIAYTYGGQVYSIPTTTGGNSQSIIGSSLPLLISDLTHVWSISADGSNRLVASGFDTSIASMSGDTINVFAHHASTGHSDSYGTYDLIRIRGNAAPVSVTVFDNVVSGIAPTLVTTVEGAALVGAGSEPSYIVPSNSMTLIASPVGGLTGGIRDGRTVVFGTQANGVGTVYLYDETTGSPRFTSLDAAGDSFFANLIDAPAPTSWFAYRNLTVGCKVARVTAAGTLDSIACADAPDERVLGTRADGAVVVTDSARVYVLASSGATIANMRGAQAPILDTSAAPPVLVGWIGTVDPQQLFACLAMHPDRCWAYPGSPVSLTTVASAANDGRFALIMQLEQVANKITIEIVRSIGPGTFTP